MTYEYSLTPLPDTLEEALAIIEDLRGKISSLENELELEQERRFALRRQIRSINREE